MQKSTVWPGKLISSKKTPKNSIFLRQNMGITSLWEDLEAKLLTPGQLLGYPLKVWGITVQTSYWEGLWHQNCGYTSPILFFWRRQEKSVKNGTFLQIAPYPKLFNGKIFRGKYPRNPYALRIQKMYMKGVYNKFLTLFWSAKVG